MKPLDPVTLAVLNGRLVQIADEMDATLFRSAFNPIIAEAHDACHGLYHAETGATLVQGLGRADGVGLAWAVVVFMCEAAFTLMAVPLLVEEPHLGSANAMIGISRQAAIVVGPALAGGIYGLAGSSAIFAVDAASFVVSAAVPVGRATL